MPGFSRDITTGQHHIALPLVGLALFIAIIIVALAS
jgi:hypothetical protein